MKKHIKFLNTLLFILTYPYLLLIISLKILIKLLYLFSASVASVKIKKQPFKSPRLVKTVNVLESFSHGYVQEATVSNNITYPITWFKQNTGLDIPTETLDENLHSFYVYTKNDKSNALKAVKEAIKNTKLYITEGVNKYIALDNINPFFVCKFFGIVIIAVSFIYRVYAHNSYNLI